MKSALKYFTEVCDSIERDGLKKNEKIIKTPQGAKVGLSDGREVINMCANNYLGLANEKAVIDAAKASYDEFGYGLSSVRFICGTQSLHKQLEAAVSDFLGTDDTILYSSCFDANGGLFETLLTSEDAVISDELNHASIIDGIRLCKAQRFRYKNNDMQDLRAKLEEAKQTDTKMIAFSVMCSMAVSLLLVVVAPYIPLMYKTTQDVRSLATFMMLITAAVMPFCAFSHAAYFTLRSGGQVFVTLLFDSAYMWLVVVPVAFCLSRFTGLSIWILYPICQGLEIVKMIFGAILLKRGTWVRQLVGNKT